MAKLGAIEDEYQFFDDFINQYGTALRSASDDYSLLVDAPGAQGEFESALFSAITIAASEDVLIDKSTLESVLNYLGDGDLGHYARQCAETIRTGSVPTA